MPYWLRQSTASQELLIGPFLSDSDGKTAQTALTIANTDVKVFKAGATSEANKNSGGGTHIASGRYYIVLDATDTNTLGSGEINVLMSGCLPVRREFVVVPAVVYDALIAGTDNFDVSVTQWNGTNVTTPDTAGSPKVTLTPGTGTGQLSLSSGAVLLQATQAGVTIPTVTTLTNAPSDSSGVTTLLSRIPSGLFTGITSLAQWLGLIAGKQTGNSTARTEIRATGSGSGTYDETTDSQEAARDNMGTTQTGDAYARLGAPAGASVSADMAAVKTDTAAIKAKTDNLPVSPAAVSDIPTANANADALLARNIAGGSSTGRTVTEALRRLRNRVALAAGVMTVYQENDSSSSWTAAVTKTAGDPVSEVDPT